MNVRITQIDGALPNIALMKLAHWHKAQGDQVHVTRSIEPTLFESSYDRVYGSAIFSFSADRLQRFMTAWPDAVIGGTGTHSIQTVEEIIGQDWEHYDYEGYPDFDASIGFTQRGCRLKCKFCVVPQKEGKPRSVNKISDIYRGEPWPKKIHLLDNDFFGQDPVQFTMRTIELKHGGFRVCFSQGINVRAINLAAAVCLKNVEYRDTQFKERKLYTAWDNLRDEKMFFAGVDLLESVGVPPKHLRVYMLIGYDIAETWERIWYRFDRMVARGIEPYPMVYDRKRADLRAFQRWVITGLYRIVKWTEYNAPGVSPQSIEAYESTTRPVV